MDPLAESMTINNINTNKHVNLVQVKKIKAQNSGSATISLDIIAGKCDYVNHNDRTHQNCKSNSALRKTLLAFSWRKNICYFMTDDQFERNEIAAVCGVQVVCIMWIILVHTCTVLFYVCGKYIPMNNNIKLVEHNVNKLSLRIRVAPNFLKESERFIYLSDIKPLFFVCVRVNKLFENLIKFT